MRWRIIRTLVHKEALRHLSNRGGIALAMLLVVMALLMAVYGRSGAIQTGAGFMRRVQYCYIDYTEEGPWVDYLKAHVPESLTRQIKFRNLNREYANQGKVLLKYPDGAGAIQLRPGESPGEKPQISCWYPPDDRNVIPPFENWFWRTTRDYSRERVNRELALLGPAAGNIARLPTTERDETWAWRELHETLLKDVGAIQAKLPPESAARIAVPEFV